MLIRAVLATLLLLPAAASAQQLDTAFSAVVRISGTRGGTPVRGSGFVVGLEGGKAAVVTASHVIEGVQQLKVTFAADRTESFPAGAIFGMDGGNPNGLAAFEVRGAIPAGVTALGLEVESRPQLGDSLFLVGFPQMELEPRTLPRVLSARRGTSLLIDQEIGEGFSGGPVLQGDKVVGVVTVTDGQTTYAVNALVLRESLTGWGVKMTGSTCKRDTHLQFDIVFVRICPGTFTMGSAGDDPQAQDDEKPAHPVKLSEYWISETEITNQQYRRFRDHPGEDPLPVTDVTWDDAKDACTHFGGRLPTEAEWEYAARAGSNTAWSFGDDEKMLSKYAWSGEGENATPHLVRMKEPNAWGLYDMYGNVLEWVADWYEPSYSSVAQIDPSGPVAGEHRVFRGGFFASEPGSYAPRPEAGSRPWDVSDFSVFAACWTPADERKDEAN